MLAVLGATVGCSRGSVPDGGTANGPELYQLCASCHGADGAGKRSVNAPAIAGLSAWYVEAQLHSFKSGNRGTHPEDTGGMQMRPMALSLKTDVDIKTVSTYVEKMPRVAVQPTVTGGNVERGKVLYGPCSACHGADGAGNPGTKGAPLRGASDWYLLEQLGNFKKGVRGTNKNDTNGAIMRPLAMTLTDDQAVKDVVAYIATLK